MLLRYAQPTRLLSESTLKLGQALHWEIEALIIFEGTILNVLERQYQLFYNFMYRPRCFLFAIDLIISLTQNCVCIERTLNKKLNVQKGS